MRALLGLLGAAAAPVALVVRTHAADARFLRHLLASVELYWPPAWPVVLALDDTEADRA